MRYPLLVFFFSLFSLFKSKILPPLASTFLGGSLTSLMMYKKPSDDPYLVVPAADTLEDTDDYLIRKTDNLLLAAVSEEDMSHLVCLFLGFF